MSLFGNSKGWPLISLKNIATLKRGYDLPVQNRVEGDIPIFAANGISGSHNTFKVKGPGVVTGRSGTIGKVHYVEGHFWPLNTALYVQDFHGNDPRWVMYMLQFFRLERFVRGAGVPTLNRNLVHDELIPLPPLAEQKRIAAILDKADQLRQKRQQAIALADDFLRSVFLDMFGDPVTNPMGWGVKKMEFLAASGKNSIKAGPFGSALKKEDYTPAGYKIYGQEQVIRDDLTYGDYYISEEKYRSLENCKITEGDLLISLVGTFGKISIVPADFEPGIINPRLMKITPDERQVVPRFLKFLLQTDGAMAKIQHMSHGGTMGIVNVGKMKGLELPIPPLEQQNRFLEIMDRLYAFKNRQKGTTEDISVLFKSFCQKAFAGDL